MVFNIMSDVTILISVFTCALIVCSVIYNWCVSRNYPPGPIGLPILGYGPFLGTKPNISVTNLREMYGDIISFYIGPQLNIYVSDYHLVKQLLSHPLTLAKPPHAFDFMVGKGGFGGQSGEEWLEQRRFAMFTMRNLGLGKGVWEKMIQEDALDFVNELKQFNGKPIDFEEPLSKSQVMNALSLLFGRHLDAEKDHQHVEVLDKFGKTFMEHFSAVNININLPWLNSFIEALNLSGYKDFMNILHKYEDIFKDEVEKRVNSNEEETHDDFIGCYLKEMQKRKDNMETTFTLENLRGNMFILFLAGHDSTVASVSWLLLLMAQHQDVQRKVSNEIERVIGRDGLVFHDERSKLPYTMATIQEMMRWVTISSLFPPRYASDTFVFEGYTIPKGAHIVANAWGMMHDPKYFPEPMEFKPERFLSEDGTKVVKLDGYGPFSFGKRNCPGEGVAMMTMYLYFVSIMQKFLIRTPDNGPPDLDYVFRAGIIPNPQKLCFLEK